MSTELPNAVFTAQVATPYRRLSAEKKTFLKQITSAIKVITEDLMMYLFCLFKDKKRN